jgi:hypothetical protein
MGQASSDAFIGSHRMVSLPSSHDACICQLYSTQFDTIRLLPFVAIVTPATLTIQSRSIDPVPSRVILVPNLDFRSLSFSATIAGVQGQKASDSSGFEEVESFYDFSYNGPSIAVQQVVAAAAIQGAVLPIDSPSANATWSVTFNGPSLTCTEADKPHAHAVKADIANATFSSEHCYTPAIYLSWSSASQGSLPFSVSGNVSGTALKLYFALLPSMLEPSTNAPWNPKACEYVAQLGDIDNWSSPLVPTGQDDASILECELSESQYIVDLTYLNGIQSVNVSLVPTNRSLSTIKDFRSTQGIDDNWLRMLSYQSVFNAFGDWVSGTISSGISQETPLIYNSSVILTALLQAQEMSYLRPGHADSTLASSYHTDLQSELRRNGSINYEGLAPSDLQSLPLPLSFLVERLFQNITVSLMSSAQLQ